MSDYIISVTVDGDPEEVDSKVRSALSAEGFGILSEIDVQSALKEKIGVDVGAYTILGACNPGLAHQAIEADPDVGALLPCNVLLRANSEGSTDVLAIDPMSLVTIAGEGLEPIAREAFSRLDRALHAIE